MEPCRICLSPDHITERKVCEDCEWALRHEGFKWPTRPLNPAGALKLSMTIPCYRRCYRVGGPTTLDESGRCPECYQTWKGPPERPYRHQELVRDA